MDSPMKIPSENGNAKSLRTSARSRRSSIRWNDGNVWNTNFKVTPQRKSKSRRETLLKTTFKNDQMLQSMEKEIAEMQKKQTSDS